MRHHDSSRSEVEMPITIVIGPCRTDETVATVEEHVVSTVNLPGFQLFPNHNPDPFPNVLSDTPYYIEAPDTLQAPNKETSCHLFIAPAIIQSANG